MNRKLVGVIVGVVAVVAVAVWWFALRDRSTAKPIAPVATPGGGGSGSGADTWAHAAAKPDDKAPAGRAPKWIHDVDPEGPLRLEGQVQDAHGDAVGKAIVTLSSVPPRTATTEEDGSFAFDKLVGRNYTLTATAGDLIGGPVPYGLTATSDPVVIRVGAGSQLQVTVVDAEGKPIVSAIVKAMGATESVGKTGNDGIATVKPMAAGWAAVAVYAEGYAPASAFTQIPSGGGAGQVRVVLQRGFTVSGRVIDERGKPIAGARVMTSGVFDIPSTLDPVMTNERGEVKFLALAPGTYTFTASDGVHAQARSAPVTVIDKPVTNVEIVMPDGGRVAGTVVDGTGKPVGFATVRIAGEGQQMWLMDSRQVTSDKSGAFEVTGLVRGQLKVRAEADGAASAIAAVDLTAQAEKRDLELVLDITGSIAGIVVDETGQGVAEIQVNAFPDILGGSAPEALAIAGMSSATTGGDGHFTLRGLPDGGYRVRAARQSAQGMYDWGQDGVGAKTGDKNVRIVLAAPGSITGKLVLEGSGKPPIAATIQLGQQAPVRANSDGTFTIAEVTPDSHDLHVRGPEFAVFSKRDVVVKPGKPTDVGTLTLVRGRKLAGRVVDAAGSGVAGAKVKSGDMLYSMQGAEDQMEQFEEVAGMRSATTDQDGRFTLIGLAKKETSVIAEHPVRGRSNAVVIAGGTDDPPAVTLKLRGFGQIVGTVTSKGKPVGGLTVTATPKDGGAQVQIVQSGTDGSFTLAKVSEGTVVVSAMEQNMAAMSMRSASTTVEVTANKQTKAIIDIPVGDVSLTVEVKALPGQKVDSAQVFLFRSVVAMKNAKELTDAFLAGGAAGMKFWFGAGKPMPEFTELVPGDYSACTIPITGDLNDSKLMQRMQEQMSALKVYCKTTKVLPSPAKQTLVHEVPAMTPLPEP